MGGLLGGVTASASARQAPHVLRATRKARACSPTHERTTPIPSKRNLRKFGRDFLVAAVGFVGLWVGANYTTLELNAETIAIGTPIALLLYRQGRKALGMEPS